MEIGLNVRNTSLIITFRSSGDVITTGKMVKLLRTSFRFPVNRKEDAISAAPTIVTLLTLTLHNQSPSYVLRSSSIHRY